VWLTLKTDATANKAVDVSRNLLKQQQVEGRPYMWLEAGQLGWVLHEEDSQGRGAAAWGWNYKNVGKSLAKNTRFRADLLLVGKEDRDLNERAYTISQSFAPGEGGHSTALSGAKLTEKEAAALRATDNQFVLRVQLLYEDLAGKTYESYLCMTNLATGDHAFCDGSRMK
jgi:hypothetical protein